VLYKFSNLEEVRAVYSIMASIGDRGDPWGMPLGIGSGFDVNPSNENRVERLLRNEVIMLIVLSWKPRWDSLAVRIVWLTVLKNPEMSKKRAEAFIRWSHVR
jgi:hypothetical protein